MGDLDRIQISAQTEVPPQPAKIKKKPGRKPNPASPAIRKAQNRAAQRAFRERKELHLKELEDSIRQFREKTDQYSKENAELRTKYGGLRQKMRELTDWSAKLQALLEQHDIAVPAMPKGKEDQDMQGSDEDLQDDDCLKSKIEPISSSLPLASPLLIQSSIPLQPATMTPTSHPTPLEECADDFHPAPAMLQDCDRPTTSPNSDMHDYYNEFTPPDSTASMVTGSVDDDFDMYTSMEVTPEEELVHNNTANDMMASFTTLSEASTIALCNQPTYLRNEELAMTPPTSPSASPAHPSHHPTSAGFAAIYAVPYTTKHSLQIPADMSQIPQPPDYPHLSSTAALQIIRMKLRMVVSEKINVPFTIKPTHLQLTIPHDPRIDCITTAHLRDRMILFRDMYDIDECVNLLLYSTIFHGGDPTDAKQWEVPELFVRKFPYLCTQSDLEHTNAWRRKAGKEPIQIDLPNLFETALST
ncbi:hypothetical protein BZG36_04332 [Bifiguratus adelaidae]|uniref:BZIP domain-containing protein n=1 Tax=Bifiguratus adelaidae TaxID=1938954 RepID=A0A261XW42_9FUNG|nr:hypothetical protein BZG36_04332 [Bifiguratus adelaidae]